MLLFFCYCCSKILDMSYCIEANGVFHALRWAIDSCSSTSVSHDPIICFIITDWSFYNFSLPLELAKELQCSDWYSICPKATTAPLSSLPVGLCDASWNLIIHCPVLNPTIRKHTLPVSQRACLPSYALPRLSAREFISIPHPPECAAWLYFLHDRPLLSTADSSSRSPFRITP